MSIIEGVTIDWAQSVRIINIPYPVGETEPLMIEDLNDTLQDIEDSEEGIAHPTLRAASGKDDLGGGILIGLTIKLLNARIKFADRNPPTVVCDVAGGNLIAVDINGNPMNPIEPSTFVTVTKTASVSAALIGSDVIDEIKANVYFLKDVMGGRWRIANNQMIFYKSDNITEVARFNLLDSDGLPTMRNVMERVRV